MLKKTLFAAALPAGVSGTAIAQSSTTATKDHNTAPSAATMNNHSSGTSFLDRRENSAKCLPDQQQV
jgi:hypothetical protein